MENPNLKLIKRLFEDSNLNESQFAKKIGVTRSYMNRILKNERNPGLKLIMGISREFPQYPIDQFFLGTVSPVGDSKEGTKNLSLNQSQSNEQKG